MNINNENKEIVEILLNISNDKNLELSEEILNKIITQAVKHQYTPLPESTATSNLENFFGKI